MESDWRKFRDMVPDLRERYLAKQNARIAAVLTAPGKTETERFWDTMEAMKEEAKTLHRCLDGHSRSSMWLFVALMIRVGMITKEDMAGFSEELQQEVARAFDLRDSWCPTAAEAGIDPARAVVALSPTHCLAAAKEILASIG
jgi:hypothetical protein